MIGLLQRVSSAAVSVHSRELARIPQGLLVLVGIQREDTETQTNRLLERLLGYRVFADDAGKMNLSVSDISGGLLLVPQFTLAADTRKGTRPGFSTAAEPQRARELFEYLLQQARLVHANVGAGEFGTDMQVSLVNDGPVTFWLEV